MTTAAESVMSALVIIVLAALFAILLAVAWMPGDEDEAEVERFLDEQEDTK